MFPYVGSSCSSAPRAVWIARQPLILPGRVPVPPGVVVVAGPSQGLVEGLSHRQVQPTCQRPSHGRSAKRVLEVSPSASRPTIPTSSSRRQTIGFPSSPRPPPWSGMCPTPLPVLHNQVKLSPPAAHSWDGKIRIVGYPKTLVLQVQPPTGMSKRR